MIDRAPLLALVSGILLVFSFGCEDLTRPPYSDGESPTPPVEDSFPPVSESSIAYYRACPDHRPARSRYVLDTVDSGFELQSLGSWGLAVHAGTYAREDSLIDFDFDGWSAAGPWEATGILENDSLQVAYNVIMLLTDFEDGTYVRR